MYVYFCDQKVVLLLDAHNSHNGKDKRLDGVEREFPGNLLFIFLRDYI